MFHRIEQNIALSELKDLSHSIVQQAIREATSVFVDEQFKEIVSITFVFIFKS